MRWDAFAKGVSCVVSLRGAPGAAAFRHNAPPVLQHEKNRYAHSRHSGSLLKSPQRSIQKCFISPVPSDLTTGNVQLVLLL